MTAPVSTETQTQPHPSPAAAQDVLVLDAHTVKDLEIFRSPAAKTCLFDFCNLTRTQGGARVLRPRMASPWSVAARIRGTQEALSFVLAQRGSFTRLPSA